MNTDVFISRPDARENKAIPKANHYPNKAFSDSLCGSQCSSVFPDLNNSDFLCGSQIFSVLPDLDLIGGKSGDSN
jgi:hypothetical protein